MARKKKANDSVKPTVFVGSSGEAVDVVAAIQLNLRHQFKVIPWTAGVFEPGNRPLADLERQLDKTSYGIFVFAPDDVTISRDKKVASTRDNVVFELGLFIGKLGSERCFVVIPRNWAELKIPSDLQGFSPVYYEQDMFNQEGPQQALSAACNEIRLTIQRRIKAQQTTQSADAIAISPSNPPEEERTSGVAKTEGALQSHLTDLLEMVRKGKAGLEVHTQDEDKLRIWARSLLKMTHETIKSITPKLPDDAYVMWLKPTQDDPDKLVAFEGENLPADYDRYYKFDSGEGLAGTIWAQGQPGIHSPKKPHPAWKIRSGCGNASYIGVPVGEPDGRGGILAVGSNLGFEVNERQTAALAAYASVLGLVNGGSVVAAVRSIAKQKTKIQRKKKPTGKKKPAAKRRTK